MSGDFLRLHQMNGAGNKILVLDLRATPWRPDAEWARAIHSEPGFAYDQMMVLEAPRGADAASYVRILNNDGSESHACGNGTRCVADVLMREAGCSEILVETPAARIACEKLGENRYRVDMGPPDFAWASLPTAHEVDTLHARLALDAADQALLGEAALAGFGNPHAVFFLDPAARFDIARLGPKYEGHPLFPEKANVSFAKVLGRRSIELKVWERAAGATLACGSAACATLVSAVRRGLTGRRATVALPGGDLEIEWREADNHVLLAGPVEYERTALVRP